MEKNHLVYADTIIPTHRLQYCPMCKSPLRREPLFADTIPRIHCAECGWIQLLTNCICVAVVVTYKDSVVVIHPPDGEGAGFPAGIVEYNENPQDTAIRETLEETGLEIEIVRDLGWSFVSYKDFPGPTLYVLFEARAIGGELREGDEGPAQLYSLKDLPPISPVRHGSYTALKRYLGSIEEVE